LFREAWKRDPVRQLGVRAEKLSDSRLGQLSLFGQHDIDRQKKLDASIDAIRRRFGDEAVMRASFLCKDDKRDHTLDRFSPFRSTGGL
jgi:DNA polymerase-4